MEQMERLVPGEQSPAGEDGQSLEQETEKQPEKWPKPDPLLEVTFQIGLDDYRHSNRIIGREVAAKKGRLWIVMGCIFILAALGFLGYLVFVYTAPRPRDYLMALGLMVLGLFDIGLYPVFYRMMLGKTADYVYRKNPYFTQPVTLRFYPEYIEEESAISKTRAQWLAAQSIRETDKVFIIKFSLQGGLIIPKNEIPESVHRLDMILKDAQERFSKQRLVIKEKERGE